MSAYYRLANRYMLRHFGLVWMETTFWTMMIFFGRKLTFQKIKDRLTFFYSKIQIVSFHCINFLWFQNCITCWYPINVIWWIFFYLLFCLEHSWLHIYSYHIFHSMDHVSGNPMSKLLWLILEFFTWLNYYYRNLKSLFENYQK